MTDLLDRLKKRVYPYSTIHAVGGVAGAISLPIQQSGTYTVGGPDKDMQDAVARIEELEEAMRRIVQRAYSEAQVEEIEDCQRDLRHIHAIATAALKGGVDKP